MRLRALVRRRVATARRGTLALLLASSSVVSAAPQQGEPVDKVRIVYRAPDECPNEAAFLAAVRSRSGSAWEASATERARRIEVTVGVAPTESTARLDFVDDDGHQVSRALTGANCADVVSAIALVTALAIDSRFTHDESQAATATPGEGANGVPSGASTKTAATPPNAAAASNASKPAATSKGVSPKAPAGSGTAHRGEGAAGAPWKGEIGVFGAIDTGLRPPLAFGGRAIAGLTWPSGADLRIGVDYLVVPQTLLSAYGGVNVAMYELAGRASGCPLALPIGVSFRISPCAGVASGIIHAETRPSAGVATTGYADPVFVALFAEGRVDARFGAFFVEASGEVRFVVDPPTFALAKPDDSTRLASMNAVAAFASLGLGLLL